MAKTRDYEVLANLKIQKKELEDKIKAKEQQILASNPADKIETKKGILTLTKRENYSVTSNKILIADGVLTEQDIIEHAKISPSQVKKLAGSKIFEQLIEEGFITLGSTSVFYTLKISK